MSQSSPIQLSSYQKFVIAILAFLQFTVILDFMILAPLGAILIPALQITTAQFGMVVSVYAFSAGISGILAAGFADRFDRKKFLMFFYTGFVLGTLLCGVASSYEFLLAARMVTGIFGGVVGSVVSAIITDLFAFEVRGRVMGIIQTAFAGSQILGLPIGMYLSNHWGWHAPFLMIVGVSILAGIFIISKLKPIEEHLKMKVDRNAFHHFVTTVSVPRYVFAFLTTALITTGGFMIMPFSSAFLVNNVKISLEDLPTIYFVTGLSSMMIGPLVGRLSDKVGKFETFTAGSILSALMVLVYTHLGVNSVAVVIGVNVVMFVGIFSRMIPSQALISAIPDPSSRGSFMAINSSFQQIAGGLASIVAGMLVFQDSTGTLIHFERVGYVMTITAALGMWMMYLVHKGVPEKKN